MGLLEARAKFRLLSMMRIHYAGGSELTGTDIAYAVLNLAEQLARTGTAATVDIPVMQGERRVGTSRLLLGPSSQLVAETEESGTADILDAELVRNIEAQVTALRPHPVLEAQPTDVIDWDPDTDVRPTPL